ncbi:MAG: glucosamine-6-phosphate deaminase [Dehalococcoidia bacterium]
MRIHIADDEREFARLAADLICDVIARRPNAVLGLPSGKTPLGVYDELARRVQDSRADFSAVTVFAVDELYGLPPDHAATNAHYFRKHLADRIPLRACLLMNSATDDPEAECARFARRIEKAGGLDLIVLGIGVNGHIAFNEPGSAFDSHARRVALDETTRAAYAGLCGSVEGAPTHGLTLGVADLLAAREALLLVTGANKASGVAQAIEAPTTETLPASALQGHPELAVVLDRAAASKLHSAKPKH